MCDCTASQWVRFKNTGVRVRVRVRVRVEAQPRVKVQDFGISEAILNIFSACGGLAAGAGGSGGSAPNRAKNSKSTFV